MRRDHGSRWTILRTCGVLLWCATIAWGAESEHSARTLRVFAAASLADAFGEIARVFEQAHPGTTVQLNLAGSQQLASQIEHGAVADVFASADDRWMAYLRERSLIAGEPSVFVRNRLSVIVPKTNPARIGRLQDLARRGVKLVIGAEAVPVGKYSREVLRNLSRTAGFPADFSARVLANVVSEEENVKSVVAKVQLGEADAGIVYRSDVTHRVSRYLRLFAIADSANVLASYPMAAVAGAQHPEMAREFMALVLSADGQKILERRGFIPMAVDSP
jgi:molybdate transport system substrate-binding protein